MTATRRSGVAICPLCAGNTGRSVDLVFRPATLEEVDRLVLNRGAKS